MREFEFCVGSRGALETVLEEKGDSIMQSCSVFRNNMDKINSGEYTLTEYSKERSFELTNEGIKLTDEYTYTVHFSANENVDMYMYFKGHEII